MTGRVFEIREFTLHDGPGIRTTVFLKGCPLRCAWCHNPEGQAFEPETMRPPHGKPRVAGVDWSAEALAEEVLVNADIMRSSGGGVTFSGGEPLAQAEFLAEVVPLLKAGGVTIAVETSGAVPSEVYRRTIPLFDFVYQDLKHHDRDAFRRWTGGDLETVLANIAWLRDSGIRHSLRIPLIPGVNDSPADRAALVALAGGSPIEFLPYNPAAGAKYPLLGREFQIRT